MAALLFSLVVHAVAIAATAIVIQPGLDTTTSVLERASYVATHVWGWRLGWLAWQLTALSDMILSVGLLLYVIEVDCKERVRAAVLFSVLGIVATMAAVVPDQWGEAVFVSTVVSEAQSVTTQGADATDYFALEAWCLLMTGTCGNTGYILMCVCWMLAAVFSAGGVLRNWRFVVAGTVVCLMFTAAGIVTWRAVEFASLEVGYPGFGWVFWLNATAFPLLLIWMVWMAHLLGKGHDERYPSSDVELHRLVWPKRGAMSTLCSIANSRGIRDLVRASNAIIPEPVLASSITDVIYLNWLVPAERVDRLLPQPLRLHCFGDLTWVSLLTYRHGHFGPKFLGPLRRLMPSPYQSNWRLYIEPETEDAPRDAIYFFKTSLDDSLLVIASRLMSDGLPSHRPSELEIQRDENQYVVLMESGAGSAPDLKAEVQIVEDRQLPTSIQEHFTNWEDAVSYLVEQNRAVSVVPTHGRIRESKIDIPMNVESICPATVDGVIESKFLEPIVKGVEPFAFVVPKVDFKALGEDWTAELDVPES